MDSKVLNDYDQLQVLKSSCPNITAEYLSFLWNLVHSSDKQSQYSKPMPLIGIYIALASLCCVLAMAADLLHGLRNRKLWFPCKYFTLNAASITMIAVVIKLPMDLTNLMPGYVDQAAKRGSLVFMFTMMTNLLPSLATMESKELFTNMIALGVLVITLVVDVCIQISTGILSDNVMDDPEFFKVFPHKIKITHALYIRNQDIVAAFYVVMLLMLLIVFACSSLSILESRQILESKYQAAHLKASVDQNLLQQDRLLTVEKLKQHVSNYWIMAETGSPHFMAACSVTTSLSGFISLYITFFHILTLPFHAWKYYSDYKWSMLAILIIQSMGVILGTYVAVSRESANISLTPSSLWKHMIKFYEVESYWTQNLYDWKHSSLSFPSCSRKCKIVIQKLKFLLINIIIRFQMVVVVLCKMMLVYFNFIKIFCFLLISRFTGIMLVQNHEQLRRETTDLRQYVLQLQEDIEFTEIALKSMLRSVNRLIKTAEKQHPKKLMNLLARSGGFEGVEMFDSYHIPPLLSEEYLNCWSLPLVTLTAISMSLPNIQKNLVECLLISGVREALVYVTLVEESLNANNDQAIIQKAAKTLWEEVDLYHKWLGNKLQNCDPQVNTAGQILQWLRDTAKNMVMEVEGTDIRAQNDHSKRRSISANSMYRITETILLSNDTNIDELSQEELFVQLSLMIADILAACLTNLPQVILMKCHTSDIEKREASVQAAAQLLGETTQIINTLQERELPSLNLDELAFIDKWRAYFMGPFP